MPVLRLCHAVHILPGLEGVDQSQSGLADVALTPRMQPLDRSARNRLAQYKFSNRASGPSSPVPTHRTPGTG